MSEESDLEHKISSILKEELNLPDEKLKSLVRRISSTIETVDVEKEWFRALVENSADILMVIDEKGNIKYISPSIEKIGGYSIDSLIGKNVFVFAHPNEVDRIKSQLHRLLQNPGIPETIEFRARHKDGYWVDIEAIGKNLLNTPVNGVVVTMRDVSKLKRIEREFKVLADYSPFGIYVCRGDRMIYTNRVAEDQTGYSKNELLNIGFSDLIPEDVRRKFKKIVNDCQSGSIYTKMMRKNGAEMWAQISFTTTEWFGDRATFFAVADVTSIKILENTLRDRNELLTLVNRILRHDILNDLTAILGLIEVYNDTADRSVLEKIEKRIKDATKMIRRMKELEVLISEGGELRGIDLTSVIEEIRVKYDVDIKVHGNCRFMADDAIYSVMDNLIRNAIDHGKSDTIEITCEQKDECCEIRVADNGVGVPDEIKDRIFEEGAKFGEGGVMGLGLYIVKKVIERYGGSVRVEDNKPKGTVFILTLRSA